MICDVCAGEVIEITPMNSVIKVICYNSHEYTVLKKGRENVGIYSKIDKKNVEIQNDQIKREKPSMSALWKEASGRGKP